MYVDTDAVRWFQQVADGMTVTEVSELEKGHPVRGVAGPGPFGDRGRHASVAPIRPNAADDPRRFGFQTPRGCDVVSAGRRARGRESAHRARDRNGVAGLRAFAGHMVGS